MTSKVEEVEDDETADDETADEDIELDLTDVIEEAQQNIAAFWHDYDKSAPLTSRRFLRYNPEPSTPKRLEKLGSVFSRLGEHAPVDVTLVFSVATPESSMSIADVADLYREVCRQDEEEPEAGKAHASNTTNWMIYEALCMLVGAGFGVWAKNV
jgi:hypothetical protein